MATLIGTAPNQVPVNGLLGTGAFIDASVQSAYDRSRANHTGTQDASTIVGLTDWQANPTGVQSINGGQLAGRRNLLMNSGMSLAFRGSSFPAAAQSGTFAVDRFRYGGDTDSVVTVAQMIDAPVGIGVRHSLRVTTTTADTSIATNQYAFLEQKIEGLNILRLIQRSFTLSFWVKSSKTGLHSVAFVNSGGDRSYAATYTVINANTWEFVTVTVNGGLPTDGDWDYNIGVGLKVIWTLAAGTQFTTAPGAWQNGNFVGANGVVNCLDTVGNNFSICAPQLEQGSTATAFEFYDLASEIQACQRYYEAALSGEGAYSRLSAPGAMVMNGQSLTVSFAATKRVTPTVVLSFTTGVTAGVVNPAPSGFSIFGIPDPNGVLSARWTADAEL